MAKRRCSDEERGSRLGVRHLQCFFIFTGLTVAYTMHVNMSVAIVAMTDRNATNPEFEEYDWNEKIKSYVLSSLFWGDIVTQLPAGHLAHYFGAKFIILVAVVCCSILTMLTRFFAAIGGWQLLCASRFVQGLCQAVMLPCTHALLSKWAPVQERGKLNTICYSGCQFGTALTLAACGLIASSSLGWPGIFYLSGGTGLIWSVVWLLFGASSPADDKFISPEERQFIEGTTAQNDRKSLRKLETPWMEFCTSVPFLSLLFVHCCHIWGYWTLVTEIPSYMSKVLDMDIKRNALLSALPYTVMWLLSYVLCFISDILTRRKTVSLNFSRRMFNTIGLWIPAAALLGMGYVSKETTNLAIGLLVIAVGANCGICLGYLVNHIDLSPNYAGTLMGITNTFAMFSSIFAPLAVGIIVSDEHDPTQWRTVFIISAVVYFLGNLVWCIFGKTEVQPWNSGKNRNGDRRCTDVKEYCVY